MSSTLGGNARTGSELLEQAAAAPANSSVWDRVAQYCRDHKAVVYTVGTLGVVGLAGTVYYVHTRRPPPKAGETGEASRKPSKSEKKRLRRKHHKHKQGSVAESEAGAEETAPAEKEPEVASASSKASTSSALPELTPEYIASLDAKVSGGEAAPKADMSRPKRTWQTSSRCRATRRLRGRGSIKHAISTHKRCSSKTTRSFTPTERRAMRG